MTTPVSAPRKIPARAWAIVVLVAVALLLFILDRQVLAVLKTTLKTRMGWTDVDYSWLVAGFSIAFTVGSLVLGRFIDRVGTRLAATLSIGVFAILHMLYTQWNNLGAALIADTLPRRLTGSAFGVLNFLIGAVGAVVNLGIGGLIQAFGYGAIFAVLGLLYPLAAAILWWFYARVPKSLSL